MKIAIVHDELMRRGGAEQVVRCFHRSFPEAPIYTLAYQPELTYSDFKECKVVTSWMQHIVSNEKSMRWLFFPFGLWAMQQLDVTDYDVVLISSTYGAKYVKVSPKALVITYCYTPFRLVWDPTSYNQYIEAKGFKKIAFDFVIKKLRKVDYRAAQRTDRFIAMTAETRDRIRRAYDFIKDIPLIKPPVDCNKFYVSKDIDNYYLVVSRLESYKRVDLAIDAFNKLGYPLIIVGRGSQESELKAKAKKNIIFKSGISNEEVAKLYSQCQALIFPQHEDYGITPLEANASGRPVIAFGKGGVLDTMIPVDNMTDGSKSTAIFFKEQNIDSLIDAVHQFEHTTFDSRFIRQHAEKFHEEQFIKEIRNFVLNRYRAKNMALEHKFS